MSSRILIPLAMKGNFDARRERLIREVHICYQTSLLTSVATLIDSHYLTP
jgi:hypothetical protein